MTAEQIFQKNSALIVNTHVVYTSGLHGNTYVNKDRIYTNPVDTSQLCQLIAENVLELNVNVVIGPAIGAVILSQWTAFHLSKLMRSNIASIYAEKTAEGFVIRRGYDSFVKKKSVLIVEDVVTTGGSLKKVIKTVQDCQGNVIGAFALCNRGGVTATHLGVPIFGALLSLNLETWKEEDCPLCKQGIMINESLGKGAKADT